MPSASAKGLDGAWPRDIRAPIRAAARPAASYVLSLIRPDETTGAFGPGLELKMSMQIVEKSGEGLSRVYGVKVTAADLGGSRVHRKATHSYHQRYHQYPTR